MTPAPPPGTSGDSEVVDTRVYETSDDGQKVCDFYLAEMPRKGWEKTVHIPADEGCVSSWQTGDGKVGAAIVVAQQPGGKAVISIVVIKQE